MCVCALDAISLGGLFPTCVGGDGGGGGGDGGVGSAGVVAVAIVAVLLCDVFCDVLRWARALRSKRCST